MVHRAVHFMVLNALVRLIKNLIKSYMMFNAFLLELTSRKNYIFYTMLFMYTECHTDRHILTLTYKVPADGESYEFYI